MLLDIPEITQEMEDLCVKHWTANGDGMTFEQLVRERCVVHVNEMVGHILDYQMKTDSKYRDAVLSAANTQADK